MEAARIKNRAICILILDGGIPGTTELSQLIIVQLIMRILQRITENRVDIDEYDELRPSDVFDFICGSGMGGVFAILFSVFQYTANEAINFYLELHERVFSTENWTQRTRSENASLLTNVILELLPQPVLEQKLLITDESRTPMFICAANSKNHAHARLLRTYKSREDSPSCTVLDAILLSIADEGHIDPYPLGRFKELFTGSGHRNSNPIQYALRETCAIFDHDSLLSCIVNIGKGNPGALTTVNSTDGYLGILRDCEESANDIARQFSGCTNLFYRLSVPQGFQIPAYDIGTVAAHTNSYLAGSECVSLTQSLGSHLHHRPGILKVYEIMTYRPSVISLPDDVANSDLSTPGNGERHDPNNSELIQTYIEEGYKWTFGIPLWDPQPTGKVVEIGDVGILTENGGFCTLFNATVPEDKQQQYRLPPNFSPFQLAEGDIEISPAPGARQYFSAGRMLKFPANNQPQFSRGPFKLPFQISHGAVLILKDSPTKITTPRDFHIQQYIEKNIENWYAFCKEGLGRDLRGQALMFVTEIRRGFDWALGAWPNVGMEKSISYAGKSTGSINNPRGVEGSWIPSHFAFKDGPFGNGPLVDEPKCPQNAFYPKMDETLGKHSIFIKCYRLGFRPLYMLPIQITVPTVSEPKSHWRDFLRQLFPTVLETCWNVVGSSSPPAPSSALQDAFFAPASFLSKIGYGIPPRHPLDDVIEEVFHNVTDAQAVIIHDDDFEALKRWSVVGGQPTNNFQLNLSQSGRCVSFVFSVPALPLHDIGPLIAQTVIDSGDTSTARSLCAINKQMNKTCIPLLYHAVKLNTLDQLRGFVDTVSSSTRLALLVRMARVAVVPSTISPVFQHCTNLTELMIFETYKEGQQKLELPITVTKLLCDAEYFTPTRRPFAPEHSIFQNITHLHLLTNFTKQEVWTWIGQAFLPLLSYFAVVHHEHGDLRAVAQDCADLLKHLPDQVEVCALMLVPSRNSVSVMDQNTIELSDGTVDPRVVVITSAPKVLAAPLGYVMTFIPQDPTIVWVESTKKEIFEAARYTIQTRRARGRYPKEYYYVDSGDSNGPTALSFTSQKGYADIARSLLARDNMEAGSQVLGMIALSIDHGNISGASPLDLLDEIMYRLNFQINEGNYCKSWRANHRREVQPYDVFDIIAGSGTGGLLAAMLSTMQMDLKTARAEYIRLSKQLFPNLFGQVFNEYSASVATQNFEASLQRLIAKYHPAHASNAHIINPSARSKTLILANKKESLRARPALFRTYKGGRNMIDCRLWQALRATTTDLRAGTFQAVDINGEKYCGTSIADGNPTASLTEELDTGISVDLILSLGCGHPDTISLPPGTSTNTNNTLASLSKDCEETHDKMYRTWSQRTNDDYGAGPYHRLNVQQSMQKMEGKHFDPSACGEVVTHSKQYMESPEVSQKIDNIVVILLERMVQKDSKLQRGPHSELPTTFHYQSRFRRNVTPKPPLGAAVDLKGRKRLLALDGGGLVGISEMLLLQSILGDKRPCDYFHLIGGSGTGGIFAILLGRYQMKISDAISVFEKCTFRVAKYLKNNTSATTIDTLTNMFTEDLENVMTSLPFSGEGVPMLRPSWELVCRSFVLVNALDNMNASRPRLFRTYASRASVEIPIPVIQAMRATTAGRSLFHDVTIGSEFLRERFGGTTYANNNPTYHLVEEAKRIWGDDQHAPFVLSLGAGQVDTIALPSSMTRATTAYFDVLKQISANCEGTHYEMARDLNPNLYHRFNVPSGLSNKSKDLWSLMDMEDVQTSTINYIETPAVKQNISRVVAALENAELEERFSKLKTSEPPTTSSYYPQPISHTSSMPNANLLGLSNSLTAPSP